MTGDGLKTGIWIGVLLGFAIASFLYGCGPEFAAIRKKVHASRKKAEEAEEQLFV